MDLAVLNILVVNAGSSSLKVSMLDDADGVVASADLPPGNDGLQQLENHIGTWPEFEVSAHRVVHGGPQARVSSPEPGRSTLITVAPRSARVIVASGPASTRLKSATSSPDSAPLMPAPRGRR